MKQKGTTMTFWQKINNWIKKIYPEDTKFNKNKKIFSTSEIYLAEIMKLKLEGEGIRVILINKRDTSYNNFGQIELYVNQDDVIRAKYLIDTPNE